MPEMGEERLKLLVYKYLDDSLTDEESDELDTYGAEHPQIWLLIARLQDKDQLNSDLGEMHGLNVQGALDEAWEMANPATIPFYKKPFWRAAGVVIPVLALAGILIISFLHTRRQQTIAHNSKDTPHIAAATPAGAQSRGYRAVLILADGQQIDLQSAAFTPVPLPHTDEKQNTSCHTLATPRSCQYAVVLPDSTKVWLNDSSRLTWPASFTDSAREVTLTGEAYFEVSKDPERPFRVRVNDLTINVLGTSFAIRAYHSEDKTTATLLKGKIAIANSRKMQLLAPNQQVSISGKDVWKFRERIDPESVLAWREGIFYFAHADIPTVMRELSNWYNIDVEIRVPPTQYYYDGEFSRDVNLSVILDYLTNEDVHFIHEGNKVIVTP